MFHVSTNRASFFLKNTGPNVNQQRQANSACVNWGWQAYTAPKYVFWFSSLCYNFALTSMSLSERPFLYDIMGGSLKISLSNGCCCMKYHLLIRISFRFGTAGWYCVMKGRIRFFALFCRRRARFLPSNFTSESVL